MTFKKLTIEELKSRIYLKHGDTVKLAPGQKYIGKDGRMVFIDKDYGEWTTRVSSVMHGCGHPARGQEKAKKTFLKNYGVEHPMHSEEVKQKIANTCIEKFGVKSPLESKEVLEKIKQTNLDKYGVEVPLQAKCIREKVQATCLKRYGKRTPLEVPDILEETRESLLESHGVMNPFESKEIREKIKQTNTKKYGGPSPMCSKQIQDKVKDTLIERHGVDNPVKIEYVKEKIKKTNLKKYGAEYPLGSDEIKEKIKKTNLEKYGVETPLECNFILEKTRNTVKERYKVDNVFEIEEIRNKIKVTCSGIYGVENPMQSEVIKQKIKETGISNGTIHVLPNGLILSGYLKNFECLHHPASCWHVYKKYGFDSLREYVEFGKSFGKDFSTEVITSSILNIPTYKKTLPFRNKPDFKLTDVVYLDIDGLFYHSEKRSIDDYHYKKRIRYEENGCRLIQIRENEMQSKPEVVKSIVDNVLRKTLTVNSEICEVKQVSLLEGKSFLEENHLLGWKESISDFIGLFHNNELLMMVGFKERKNFVELVRICSKVNLYVKDGLKKLVGSFYKEDISEIFSWCDLRFMTGKSLESLGFLPFAEIIDWCYTDFLSTYPKEIESKSKLYDAGKRLYIKKLGTNA